MIDEKAILCAFAYAEHESDCSKTNPASKRQEYMKQCAEYIRTGREFPEQATEPMLKRMTLRNISDPREYIYSKHFATIMQNIEDETGQTFYTAIKNPLILNRAINCPTNLYEIVSARKNQVIGQNIITQIKKELTILEGMEYPKIRDIISSHWSCGLEILTDWMIIKKYTPQINAYLMRIKDNLIKKT